MQTKTIFIITIIFSILYSYSFADESTIPDRPTNSAEYYTKQGDSFRERKMNYEAKDAYEKAIKLDANAGSAHFGLGRIHARLNKFDNAITELELAIKIDPENNIEAFRL
ncbi:MAG: tetratricopeptide repeat protein, partial [Candidatus Omnitrophica bacterium]|nr:tetratricopeptide repeat protein [Candidatus Omnitrophota bacterium]